MEITEIDLTLISGRRPKLLELTLKSFQEHVFPGFEIHQVFANIDPYMGTTKDGETCREMILHYFPDAELSMPATPGFGLAVKNLWSKISSPVALHLEDDWLAIAKVDPEEVFELLDCRTKMVTMFHQNNMKHWRSRRQKFKTRSKRIRYTPFRIRFPWFTLCPCFVEREFANQYSELISPDLDPESQASINYGPYNKELFQYCKRFKNAYLKLEKSEGLIMVVDTGRPYRAEHGIVKIDTKHDAATT